MSASRRFLKRRSGGNRRIKRDITDMLFLIDWAMKSNVPLAGLIIPERLYKILNREVDAPKISE